MGYVDSDGLPETRRLAIKPETVAWWKAARDALRNLTGADAPVKRTGKDCRRTTTSAPFERSQLIIARYCLRGPSISAPRLPAVLPDWSVPDKHGHPDERVNIAVQLPGWEAAGT